MNIMTAALGLVLSIAVMPALAAPAPQIQIIAAADVKSHVGQTIAVEGTVSDVHHARSGHTVMLDMNGHYPNNVFTAVIFESDIAKFSDLDALSGKTVRLTGTIKLYRDKPEIVLSDPGQIKVN